MRVVYFEDTDTAFLEFSAETAAETREVCEHVYLDVDAHGRLVSMTIDHAGRFTTLPAVSVERPEAE